MATFDRFDIVSAHDSFCVDHREGQFSAKYERLSRIRRCYSPGLLTRGYETLTENGREIYRRLERHSKV